MLCGAMIASTPGTPEDRRGGWSKSVTMASALSGLRYLVGLTNKQLNPEHGLKKLWVHHHSTFRTRLGCTILERFGRPGRGLVIHYPARQLDYLGPISRPTLASQTRRRVAREDYHLGPLKAVANAGGGPMHS
jgi:hypothetical protein